MRHNMVTKKISIAWFIHIVLIFPFDAEHELGVYISNKYYLIRIKIIQNPITLKKHFEFLKQFVLLKHKLYKLSTNASSLNSDKSGNNYATCIAHPKSFF